ncbi:MAG: PH domain-containing protein [Pseudorhodobacter sp.]|nr:PH domain-containing protein [Frankiaceae bacterium]
MLRPSPKLWRVRLLQLGLVSVPVLLAVTAVGARSGIVGALAGLLVASAAVGVAALSLRRRVLSWGYAERADDLVVSRGVLVRRTTVVPYGRMQFLDVTAGPFERAFGLATVQLHTAAAASDARIPGLLAAEAARLRDRLAQLGEARAQGL